MKKLLLAALLLFPLTIFAIPQRDFGGFRKKIASSQETTRSLVTMAVEPGVFILAQSYQLEDSVGKFFGHGGNKEFGSDNSLAIKVKNGYLFPDKARVPWEYDPRFSKAKKRYRPVFFPSQYSEMGKQLRFDSIYYNPDAISTLYPDQLYGLKTNFFFNEGFATGHNSGETEGYMVWFTVPENCDFNTAANINMIVMRQTLNLSDDRAKEYNVELPDTDGDIFGGIFIYPEISAVGALSFTLEGVAVGDGRDWRVICPFSDDDNVFQESSLIITETEDDLNLTPNDNL